MNGPQHYKEAELLLNDAEHGVGEWAAGKVSKAQVHAVLALAAATAAAGADAMDGAAATGWQRAAGIYVAGLPTSTEEALTR